MPDMTADISQTENITKRSLLKLKSFQTLLKNIKEYLRKIPKTLCSIPQYTVHLTRISIINSNKFFN